MTITARAVQTGMPRPSFDEMLRSPIPALASAREQTLYARRGNRRSLTPGTGAKAKLTPAERILATVLHQRKLATHDLLGELFNVTPIPASRAVREVLPVLTAHGYQITAPTARFRTPADVRAYLAPEATDPREQIESAS